MKNRLRATLDRLQKEKQKALVCYFAYGDISPAHSEKLILSAAANGADIIEIGVPFSDPLADGPVIQHAYTTALTKGVGLDTILSSVKKIRTKTTVPLVLMGYYNVVLRRGEKQFVRDCAAAGVDGFIIPDLPPEEAGGFCAACEHGDIATIFLTTPTTTPSRLALIDRLTTGFVYHVSLTGVTGVRTSLPPDVTKHISAFKKKIIRPLFVGFGVSNPAMARELARYADGVIVGSALVKLGFENAGTKDHGLDKIAHFVSALSKAVHK